MKAKGITLAIREDGEYGYVIKLPNYETGVGQEIDCESLSHMTKELTAYLYKYFSE